MKEVLVPLATFKNTKEKYAPFHFARETYIKKLVQYHLLPYFVSHVMTIQMIDELYDQSQGVLLMGGADWNPSLYGETKGGKTQEPERGRDMMEQYILKKVLADKKPFLGICRGHQGLAIASGGKLIQHVADEFPSEKHDVENYDGLFSGQKHEVVLDPSSRIAQLLGKEKINVNSGHHQAVREAGHNMKIVGESPAGVAEIIEHTDSSFFCYGVQCHPEADTNGDLERLFAAFAKAVVSS
ncbi:MAG: gamma-glutamyl-gamma-aminobutyrate hydrolase family protein [bacterium]|nr:gamma-glutamyl-gamma-aminobutyrate hydrolase family protein [bacterium]